MPAASAVPGPPSQSAAAPTANLFTPPSEQPRSSQGVPWRWILVATAVLVLALYLMLRG